MVNFRTIHVLRIKHVRAHFLVALGYRSPCDAEIAVSMTVDSSSSVMTIF